MYDVFYYINTPLHPHPISIVKLIQEYGNPPRWLFKIAHLPAPLPQAQPIGPTAPSTVQPQLPPLTLTVDPCPPTLPPLSGPLLGHLGGFASRTSSSCVALLYDSSHPLAHPCTPTWLLSCIARWYAWMWNEARVSG